MRNEPLRQKATKPSWSYVWSSMSSFRKKFVLLLSIVLVDTVLTSLGIGMILPIFQSILSVDIEDQWLTKIFPGFAAFVARIETSGSVYVHGPPGDSKVHVQYSEFCLLSISC